MLSLLISCTCALRAAETADCLSQMKLLVMLVLQLVAAFFQQECRSSILSLQAVLLVCNSCCCFLATRVQVQYAVTASCFVGLQQLLGLYTSNLGQYVLRQQNLLHQACLLDILTLLCCWLRLPKLVHKQRLDCSLAWCRLS